MIKKISAVVLALTLTVCSFAGCSSKKDSSSSKSDASAVSSEAAGPDNSTAEKTEVPDPSFTVGGEKIDTADYVMCTIDGIDITFDEFRFYYYYTLNSYTTNYGITADSLKENEDTFKQFMDDVILCIKQELVTQKLAQDNDIELDDDDKKTIDSQLENVKSNYESEEAYQNDLKQGYLTEDVYYTMLERAQIYSKVVDTLFKNDGKYATKKDDFLKIVKDTDQYCREIHVMIPYYSQVDLDDSTADSFDSMTLSQKASAKQSAYSALDEDGQAAAKEKAKKVADEVLEKAKNGDDFEKLVEEYGWDVGLEDTTNGYYFEKDNTSGYPEELVDAVFKLKEKQVCDKVVENTTYGYFIIKRLKVDMDYVNENLETMIYSYDQPAIQEVYNDVIDKMKVTYCDSWDKITADSIT